MRNALEVLTEMNNWWCSASPVPRTTANAVQVGITWLFNRTYADFTRLQTPGSKIAHFRQLFTVWKAVAVRWKEQPYYDPNFAVIEAFPAYLEKHMPDQFIVALDNRVFLGAKFTPEDQRRHAVLRERFIAEPPPARRTQTPHANIYREQARR